MYICVVNGAQRYTTRHDKNKKNNNMNYTPIKNASGNKQLIEAIISEVSNRRKHDKSSIAYMIGMMDSSTMIAHYYDSIKRENIISRFIELINTDKINRLNNGYCLANVFKNFQ